MAEGSSGAGGESHPHGAPEAEPTVATAEAAQETPEEADAAAEPPRELPPPPPSRPVSPWIIAPFSGAAAAALVIGVGWMLGWPPVQPPSPTTPLSTAVDELSSRVATLEQRTGKPDTAVTGHIDAVDKAIAAVRSDVAALRSQNDKTVAALNDVKAQPRDSAASPPAPAPVDLSGLTARIDALERASKTQSAALAQDRAKLSEAAQAKPADDAPLRRVVAATLLDVAVRHGDPYAAALSTAKSLAPDGAALKPLDTFAASGVPSPAALSRELLTIVPKLTPPAPEGTTGTSILSKLSAGAQNLVKVERTDGAGTDRGAVVARITAAALRNDLAEARRELKNLSAEDRAPASDWLAKADARDAALSTARKFADDSMTALAKPAQ
ncbi:conserved hypothetical protein [Bradyrhizobium sp. ORS 375]|nr:conserved hypothetical protein [Bradyrhizobium sp. ORS 375]